MEDLSAADPNIGIIADGILLFGEGSLRGLAAATVFLAAIIVHKSGTHPDTEFEDPQVVLLISSLMNVRTRLDSAAGQPVGDSMILRILNQNKAAKTQAVSSWQWAVMLKSMSLSPGSSDVDYQTLMDRYNNHPEVMSLRGNPDSDDKTTGTGNISLTGHKKLAVQYFLRRTSPKTWDIFASSCHDIPWKYGPFGEQYASKSRCFIGSKSAQRPQPDSPMKPLHGEPTIAIDYNLMITETNQHLLVMKLKIQFDRDTALVPLSKKSSYRPTQDELGRICDIIGLYGVIMAFLRCHMPSKDVDAFEHLLVTSRDMDSELESILDSLPTTFSASMLPFFSKTAKLEGEAKQQKICIEVENSRLEVRSARYNFLEAALARDVSILENLQKLPALVATKLHVKTVEHNKEQTKKAALAIKQYTNTVIVIKQIKTPEGVLAEVTNQRSLIVTRLVV